MRVFHVQPDQFTELDGLPQDLPEQGFIWLGSAGVNSSVAMASCRRLQRWVAGQLVDLHVSDLLNQHLPSHFDYTSWYDMLVFRRWPPAPAAKAGQWRKPGHGAIRRAGAGFHRHQPGGFCGVRPRAHHRAPHRLRRARLLCRAPGRPGWRPKRVAWRACPAARPT
jgi:hypothetical protein